MSELINIDEIIIPDYHRAIKPYSLQSICKSIEYHGYNIAYPVIIDKDKTLVDGRHRVESARALGIISVPFEVIPDDQSIIRYSLQCNADGQLCQPDDVFDLSELCYTLSRTGWTGERIAAELGWDTSQVTRYKAIKENLHPMAWDMARLPRNGEVGNEGDENLGNQELPIVNWSESHFRALLRHLSYRPGDHAIARSQIRVIKLCLARANEKDKRFGETQKKVTASWITSIAGAYAWYVKLGLYMRDNLVKKVPFKDRKILLKNIYNNVWGDKEDEANWEKFKKAIAALNEKALGVILYHDDAFSRIPLLDDKSIALVVTDPPYNVTEEDWDKIGTDAEYLEFTSKWLYAIKPKLCEDYHLFFFCDPDYAALIEGIIKESGYPLLSRIIWWNRSLPSGRGVTDKFVRTWQIIFHCGTHQLNWNPEWSDERFDVQQVSAPNANTNDGGYHPTPKPVKLIQHLVNIGSKPGDLVTDIFAGGGTTGEACINITQRQCILIEKSGTFCQAIEKRLKIAREV